MISVIIPTLNAEAYLAQALAPLVEAAADGLVKQVIVADGGSGDATLAIAEAAGCDIVMSQKGRARQMIAGADAARAPWLLFLHADTVLERTWLAETHAFITRAGAATRAAAYTFAFDDDSAPARRVQYWARARATILKLPYGDQGLLISRQLYDALGGYRDIGLMEDVDIVRRIGVARLTILKSCAVTSADKYRRDGFSRRAWRNLGLLARYYCGADPNTLAQGYD